MTALPPRPDAHGVQPFSCSRCGAVQSLPADLAAITMRCQFCHQETPLPDEILASRREERRLEAEREMRESAAAERDAEQRKKRNTALVVTGVSVLGPLIGVGVLIFIVARSGGVSLNTLKVTSPIEIESAAPVRAPPRLDPHATGSEQVTARLKNLYDLGCKTVIMAPAEAVGTQSLQTDLVMNGTCLRIVAVCGVMENKLIVAMKNPFGEPIETPKPSAEIDFTYCPKNAGPHPTRIVPDDDNQPYTIAAVECPANMGKKK